MKNVEAKSWHLYISKQKAPVNGVFVFNKPKQNVIFESYLNKFVVFGRYHVIIIE